MENPSVLRPENQISMIGHFTIEHIQSIFARDGIVRSMNRMTAITKYILAKYSVNVIVKINNTANMEIFYKMNE